MAIKITQFVAHENVKRQALGHADKTKVYKNVGIVDATHLLSNGWRLLADKNGFQAIQK